MLQWKEALLSWTRYSPNTWAERKPRGCYVTMEGGVVVMGQVFSQYLG